MTGRTGSYPLMNLAEDFGVDYGDVLVWAGYLRAERQGEKPLTARVNQLARACCQMQETAGRARYLELFQQMIAHANSRWGRPQVVSA